MKKLLLFLILAFLFEMQVMSQTPYWEEDFSGNPAWTLDGNWALNPGYLRFDWTPTITNFDCSAVSPVITLHEYVAELVVNQHLDAWETGVTNETAEIWIITDTADVLLWSYLIVNGNLGNPSGSDTAFSISQYAGQDVQIKFRTHGATTYSWDWWDVFNVSLTAYFDDDLAVTSMGGPNNITVNTTGSFQVEVKNNGLNPKSNFTVELFSLKTGELVADLLVSDVLITGQTENYTIDWTPANAHNTALYAVATCSVDDFWDNNIFKSHFLRVSPDYQFNVLIWDNDNDIETLIDPEKGDLVQPEVGLTRAFDAAGINYELLDILPSDLSQYDMIFGTLGLYCLG